MGIQSDTFKQRAAIGKYTAWALTAFDGYLTHRYIAGLVRTGTTVDFYLFTLNANTVVGVLGAAFISVYQLTIISMLFNPSFFAKFVAAPKNILTSLSPEAAKFYRVILYAGLAALGFGFFKVCQINLQGTINQLGTGDNDFARFLSMLLMIAGEVSLHLSMVNELMAEDSGAKSASAPGR